MVGIGIKLVIECVPIAGLFSTPEKVMHKTLDASYQGAGAGDSSLNRVMAVR